MENHYDQCSSSEESKDKQIGSKHDENYVNTQTPSVYDSIPSFCSEEVEALKVGLENKDTYREAMKILIAWIEVGYCTHEAFQCFYLFIEKLSKHINKLRDEHEEYVMEIQRTSKSVLKKKAFQLKYVEFINAFDTLTRKGLWDCFNRVQNIEMFKMRATLLFLNHNMLNECVCDEGKVNLYENMTVKFVHQGCDIPDMEAKLPNYTNELNTVYRLTKKMKARCFTYRNVSSEKALENDCAEAENKRSEIKNRRNQPSDPEREEKEKYLDVEFPSRLEPDVLDRNVITIAALLLHGNPEGVNFRGIYSYLQRYIKCACPIKFINVLKKYPHFFEGTLPTEDAHFIKKRRLLS